ncbi:MAG: mannose-6-phosphate isomerase, class I [Spirochaetes bacterium]|nr:mannose-6-phosphate isomerase, class I [Spirochaetota bacterium]
MAVNEFKLDILGAKFAITSDENESSLQETLNEYRAAIKDTQEITGISDPMNVAVLTGFLLCGKINKLQRQMQEAESRREGEMREMDGLAQNLIASLDQVMKKTSGKGAGDNFFKLQNQNKHYEWGSPDFIPAFLGIENSLMQPFAEMWMGSHVGAPSLIKIDRKLIPLTKLIAERPQFFLGKKIAEKYGDLPFLFKLLAAGKPLSIQAHPNLERAKLGYERENKAGLALNDPKRNYKDPNHKPEIICALDTMTLMCGFRKPAEICIFLEAFLLRAPFLSDVFKPLLEALQSSDGGHKSEIIEYESLSEYERKSEENAVKNGDALKNFFAALFNLPKDKVEELCSFITETAMSAGEDDKFISAGQWELLLRFAELYPGDPSVLSPLYLNVLTLKPGQALFVGAGVLHAYISGFGVELMAASDNVLRGGLTSKHIDIPELMEILDFSPCVPQLIEAPPPDSALFRYPAPCEEFSLSLMRGEQVDAVFGGRGPAICIVTEGELSISGESFKKGEAVFIPAEASPLSFAGAYRLFIAAAGEL